MSIYSLSSRAHSAHSPAILFFVQHVFVRLGEPYNISQAHLLVAPPSPPSSPHVQTYT